MQASTMSAGARVAVAQRDQLTRVDLLSVDASVLPIQIPRLTFVIDRRANTVTLWNDAARAYYTQPFLPQNLSGAPRRPTPDPGATSKPVRPERSMLANLDLLTFDLRLTGHSTIVGIASTGLAFDMKVRQHGKTALTHANGTVQVADDFAFFPVRLQAQIASDGLASPASVVYTIDTFDRQIPSPDTFAVPDGYTRVTSLLRVFSGSMRRAPSPSPVPSDATSPVPAASPTATP